MTNKLYQFACNVTAGRTLGCKDVIGGIQKVFLMVFDEDLYTGMQQTDNEITELPTITVFQYDLRPNTATFNSNFTSDDATGTTYYEQVLDVTLQKIVHEDLNQLDLITKGRTQVFVLDANDNCFLMGAQFGCSVTAGAMSTGTAKGDLSGFTLTFTAQERENYMLKETSGIGTSGYPFDGIDTPSNVTITAGTYPS